jgi:arylsulfatase A-like enzyme
LALRYACQMASGSAAALRLALAAVLLAGCGGASRDPRPDLLLVSVDTLRPDRLACYGGEPDVGRALCRIAERGTRFVWAVSTSPSTAPSVASILTSRYPGQHGVSRSAVSFLAEDAVSVAELLREAGYATAAFVCNPVLDRLRNLGQGFDLYDDSMTHREPDQPKRTDREARAATEAALAWLRDAEPPWFLWIHYQDPHGPYAPPGAPEPSHDDGKGRVLPVLSDHSGHEGIPAYQAVPNLFTVGAYQRRYLDEIRHLDAQLERLIDAVDARGRPVGILLTADHGEAFGEDGYYFAHGHSVGLDQIRVPLLWRAPEIGAAGVIRSPVSTLDVAPTLLAAAGLEAPAAFRGRPLPAADAPDDAPARPLFAEHRLRAAVLVGSAYYARDRRPLDGPVLDRISGGKLHPMVPRTARLGAEGRLPAYESAGDAGAGALEELLAEFLSAGDRRVEPSTGPLSPETRERLEALGYLE